MATTVNSKVFKAGNGASVNGSVDGEIGVQSTGRKILWVGDSITDGAGASGAGNHYIRKVEKMIGSLKLARSGLYKSRKLALPGENAAAILAALPTVLTSENPDLVFMMIGANASANISSFIYDVSSIIDLVKGSGARCVIGLVTPRAAAETQGTKDRIVTYNKYLQIKSLIEGVELVDTTANLIDANGDLDAAFASDLVHPNDAGHQLLAESIVPAIEKYLNAAPPTLSSPLANGLIANSLFVDKTGWINAGGATATSQVVVPEADDVLTAGNWYELTLDRTGAGASFAARSHPLYPEPSEGDELLISFAVKQDSGSTPGVGVVIDMSDDGTSKQTLVESFGKKKPGQYLEVFTVPAGTTALSFRMFVYTTADEINKAYMGQVQVINLTILGLHGLI